MIRSLGGVLGQGIIVVVMEFAPSRATGLQYAFVGFGLLLILCLPIVLTIPDTAREARRKEESTEWRGHMMAQAPQSESRGSGHG
jgi:hypothetical protein